MIIQNIFNFLQEFSPLHSSAFFMLFFIFVFNLIIPTFLLRYTEKPYNRFFFYSLFLPFLLIIKVFLGTTFFVKFNTNLIDLISYGLVFALIYMYETVYFLASRNAYHKSKQEMPENQKTFLDVYISCALLFIFSLLNFYPIH